MRVCFTAASLRRVLMIAGVACSGQPGLAQDYPNRQITMVVSYPGGGGADAVPRLTQELLTASSSLSIAGRSVVGLPPHARLQEADSRGTKRGQHSKCSAPLPGDNGEEAQLCRNG